MLISFWRIIKFGWKNFKRNSGFSLAMIFVMVLVISVITFLIISQKFYQALITQLKEKVDMRVYLKEELKREDVLKIKEDLSKISWIKEIEYISKEKALEDFERRHQNDEVIMESLKEVGENPLLASLTIKAKDPAQYAAIANFLKNSSFKDLITKIDYYQKKPAIERLSSIISWINKAGIILSFTLVVIAILVAFNTTRLTIASCKEEIETMRLVGASGWFTRGPFVIQSIIGGIFAVIITCLIFIPSLMIISPKLTSFLGGVDLSHYFFENLYYIIGLQLIVGISISSFSSIIATQKYLNI